MGDPVEEIAKELASHLPVKNLYEDALKKPAKEIGNITSDILKTLMLVVAPIQYFAALQDRFRNFLDKSVRRVPEENRVSPAPQILGPVLEGIRFEPEETPIDEMFSQLLSRSMDTERIEEAHPSYPWLIKQISSDEAVILLKLKDAEFEYVYTSSLERNTMRFTRDKTEVDEFPREILQFPQSLSFYMNHLSNLGLAGIYDYKNQEPICEMIDGGNVQTGTKVFCKYRLTDVGQRFMHACTDSE